jgi:hypothetical protein
MSKGIFEDKEVIGCDLWECVKFELLSAGKVRDNY